MGRIVVTEFISLDGVIDSPGGGDDYEHAGWTFEYEQGEGGQAFKVRELVEAEAQLLGRVTYDGFAAAWPTMEGTGEFGEKMNAMPKYVVSSTLTTAEWTNTTILSGEVTAEVSELKRQIDGVILVAGSAQLVQALIPASLVDELRLMVFPVVLGSGKRLFAAGRDKWPLTLTASETVGDGLEILTYQPVNRA